MSTLTSPGLVSPPAVAYTMEALCRKQPEEQKPTRAQSPIGRTMEDTTSPPVAQNGDYDGSVTSGDKQDELSANEDHNNYDNIIERDYDDELSDSDDEDDLIIGDHASLDVTMATETTETSSILMSTDKPKRNKRKNFKPRNISYAEDESGNNHRQNDRDNCESDIDMDVDDNSREIERFHKPLDLSDSTTLPTAPKRRRKPVTAPQRRLNYISNNGNGNGGVPMDLSCSRNSSFNDEACVADDENESGDDRSESGGETQSSFQIRNSSSEFSRYHDNSNGFVPAGHRDSLGDRFYGLNNERRSPVNVATAMFNARGGFPRFLSPEQLNAYQHMPGTDASAMKEYAENTMKELLSIYGLSGGDMAENITKNVPMANFSSGKILETLSPKHLPSSGTFQLRPLRSPRSPPSQPPTPPRTPLTPPHRGSHSPQPSHHSHPHQTQIPQGTAGSDHQAAAVYEQIRHKMAKLAGLPANSINSMMGNQRVMLPQNMATILTLAAMQEQQGKASGSGPHHGSPLPGGTTPPSSGLVIHDPTKSGGLLGHRMSPMSPVRDGGSNGKSPVPIDYSRYVKRFSSALECGSTYCKDLNYREHFHCLDCNSRVFVKKEEMIRHFKWHKKRDESLQHGFMRYSPMDDCSDKYTDCTHNRKQTHYHCIKDGCDKVYISTSDVQMHANYHRKDSAIIQEGFQRFRATEECGATYCSFFGQRTTHFHCRRDNCKYTFKNKADMEKHKSYHIKDEQLNRDGFKKFMKQEACPFESCRFSRVCNHIHCIRAGCSYVLHSSGQLFSHKRKHERQDSELAYRKFKLAQSMMKTFSGGETSNASMLQAFNDQLSQHSDVSSLQQGPSGMDSQALSNGDSSSDGGGRSSPLPSSNMEDFGLANHESNNDPWEDLWPKYLARIGPEDRCPNCDFVGGEHFHCLVDACGVSFRCMDGVREHARSHEQQDHLSEAFYSPDCETDCPYYQSKERHYHCTWDNCREVILHSDKPFRRLDHYKMHEYSRKLSLTKDPLISTHLATSIDGMFRRKRGRPPKNRVIEFPNAPGSLMDSPQAIFTSFKLPKPSATSTSPNVFGSPTMLTCQPDLLGNSISSPPSPGGSSKSSTPRLDILQEGFYAFGEGAPCPDALCIYARTQHFHCSQQRCFYATEREDLLLMHAKDFHDNIDILDGFLFFDRAVDCRLPSCHSNKVNRHFHCVRPNCGYSFVRYSTMAVHEQKHKLESVDGPQVMNHFGKSEPSSPIHIKTELNQDAHSQSSPQSPGNLRPNHSNANSPEASNKTTESPRPDWMLPERHVRYGPDQSCCRPFCKLKRKEHYHCNACNQAFSEVERLKPHIAKHSSGALSPQPALFKREPEDNNNDETNDSGGLPAHYEPPPSMLDAPPPQMLAHPSIYPPHSLAFNSPFGQPFLITSQSMGGFMPPGMPAIYTAPGGGLMFGPPMHHALVNGGMDHPGDKRARSPQPTALIDMSPEAKKARVQNSMRILKDEPVPEGYVRYRFNEDCKYAHCGYREHQTHFHCMRPDCGYSFCDKTRFVQHTARHERLDTLMGGDFQQFRANVPCGRQECVYTSTLGAMQNKASHFHCLKCEFVCTDTNKVVAHRRQHQKLDSIMAAGFEKFTPSQPCALDSCAHSGKQTHYHCLSCQYAVLGLSQMSAHKYRHMD